MTFTELKDAVGMRDSGGFQYHLNALDGTFLRKTDDGYTHLAGGIALYRAMLGSVMGPDAIDPIPLDERCPNCESPLELRYDHQVFYVYCAACDESASNGPFLPAGLDGRSNEDRIRAFDRWTKRLIFLLRDGICPWCSSTVSHGFDTDGKVEITHTCDRCRGFLRTTVLENVVSHPAVISFYYDHGIDVTTTPYWKLGELAAENTRVLSEDPPKLRTTIRLSGDELVLVLDGEMRVRIIDEQPRRTGTRTDPNGSA
ncbi:hypothetical protein A4G99_23180 [Haladaptatus sp. R4]|uniref:DUF7351 domain-containing protein n=1 Tax=Haladaptatus sp. R4 TaxID=1679489 RepID=UPI0007B4E98A|nr:hypothetical protein [Haladaptatus sp. R4]KZN26083.1 hypothetical protein A4G99_23180 [Haladaptatus sp. R4]